jgi:release factor glutamine methyltransferase
MRYNTEHEILLAEILGKPKEFLIAHPEIQLTKKQYDKFEKMSKQLKSGWPLAYVLGYKWFYGNKFMVNKDVLIPRPETEQLIDLAFGIAKNNTITQIVDIGTGPGTIILTLRNGLKKSKVNFSASDISAKALAVAKKNAKALKTSGVRFHKGNLLTPFNKSLLNKSGVLITANLPYLSKKQLAEPSIKREPKLALLGGKRSYDKIEQLLKQTSKLKLSNSWILLEINYDQAKVLAKIIKKYLPKADIKIHKDFSKFDRFVEIYIP